MKTLNTKPMVELIFNHLLSKGSITNVEAQALYRCRALPRRIADLKVLGMPITSVLKKDATGQRYARYELNTEAL
jgi:hypothetical protein